MFWPVTDRKTFERKLSNSGDREYTVLFYVFLRYFQGFIYVFFYFYFLLIDVA